MSTQLPLELVAEVLGIVAEASLADSSRHTAFELARACSLAYNAMTPILYRTLTVDSKNQSMSVRIFNAQSTAAIGVLSEPPLRRLCVHVRRAFLENTLRVTYLYQLPNLSAIYSCWFGNSLFESDNSKLARTVTHVYTMTSAFLDNIPQSVTHASFYLPYSRPSDMKRLKRYMRSLSLSVTHIAVEMNEPVKSEDTAVEMLGLLQDLLARNSTAPVIIRLYRDAGLNDTALAIILDVKSRLEAPEARLRVQIWHDKRDITAANDILISKWDAIAGRTAWSEAL